MNDVFGAIIWPLNYTTLIHDQNKTKMDFHCPISHVFFNRLLLCPMCFWIQWQQKRRPRFYFCFKLFCNLDQVT